MSSSNPIAYSPLDGPPQLFAEHGASAHADPGTLDAYSLAVRLGATGVRAGLYLDADGVAVLSRDDSVGGRIRRRKVGSIASSERPANIVAFSDLFDGAAATVQMWLDVADVDAVDQVLERAARDAALHRLWLASGSLELLSELRSRSDQVHLVNTTALADLPDGPERRAAQLRERSIDAVAMDQLDWNAGMVALFHRFRRLAVATGARHRRMIEAAIAAGADGVASVDVDAMVDVADAFGALHRD